MDFLLYQRHISIFQLSFSTLSCRYLCQIHDGIEITPPIYQIDIEKLILKVNCEFLCDKTKNVIKKVANCQLATFDFLFSLNFCVSVPTFF